MANKGNTESKLLATALPSIMGPNKVNLKAKLASGLTISPARKNRIKIGQTGERKRQRDKQKRKNIARMRYVQRRKSQRWQGKKAA